MPDAGIARLDGQDQVGRHLDPLHAVAVLVVEALGDFSRSASGLRSPTTSYASTRLRLPLMLMVPL